MAEVGEKQRLGETKTRARARKRENEKAIIRELKEAMGRKGLRKFELVGGFFSRSWALCGRTWWSRWSYYKRFESRKGWKLPLKTPWSLDALDVQIKSNAQDFFLLVFLGRSPRNWWGLEVKIERSSGLDEDEENL